MKTLGLLLIPLLCLAISWQAQAQTGCPCQSDIIFVVELGSDVDTIELGNIKDFLYRLLQKISDDGNYDCFRTALITYSNSARLEYGFDVGSIQDSQTVINDLESTGEGRNLHLAFHKAFELFENDDNPTRTGCRTVILLTGHVSANRTATLDEAQHLFDGTLSRLLVVDILDHVSLPEDECTKDKEIEDLVGIFNTISNTSRVVISETFRCCVAPDEDIEALLGAMCYMCTQGCRCDLEGLTLTACSGEVISLANYEAGSKLILLTNGEYETEMTIESESSDLYATFTRRSASTFGDGQELVTKVFQNGVQHVMAGSFNLTAASHVAINDYKRQVTRAFVIDGGVECVTTGTWEEYKVEKRNFFGFKRIEITTCHTVTKEVVSASAQAAQPEAVPPSMVILSIGDFSGLCFDTESSNA